MIQHAMKQQLQTEETEYKLELVLHVLRSFSNSSHQQAIVKVTECVVSNVVLQQPIYVFWSNISDFSMRALSHTHYRLGLSMCCKFLLFCPHCESNIEVQNYVILNRSCCCGLCHWQHLPFFPHGPQFRPWASHRDSATC